MKTVAFFGGSFDPPHIAHQVLCLMVLEATEIDQVWMVPTFQHVFGKVMAPFSHRFALCERIARPFGDRVVVSDIEAELGGESRTLGTLEALTARHPEIAFRLLVGADILAERHRWHRWDDVARLAPPLVVARAGFPGGDLPAPPDISSREIRNRLGRGESALPLVPRAVMDYIAAEGLYR